MRDTLLERFGFTLKRMGLNTRRKRRSALVE